MGRFDRLLPSPLLIPTRPMIMDDNNSAPRPRLAKSAWAHIIGLALAILAFSVALIPLIAGHAFDSATLVELFAGFIVFFATVATATIMQQLELADEAETTRSDQARALAAMEKRVLEQIRHVGEPMKDYATLREREWSRDAMRRLARAVQTWNNRFDEQHLELSVKEHLEVALHKVTKGDIEFPKEKEHSRLRLLQDLVSRSEHHVHAVTVDIGDYLTDTFGAEGQDNLWIKPNTRRLLILSGDVIDRKNRFKCGIVDRLARAHLIHGGELRVLSLNGAPARLSSNLRRSFLICDDIVVSESYSLPEGAIAGYVRYNSPEDVRRLRPLFDDLWDLGGAWSVS